jgi:Calcineurin-like phosphoesterase
MSEEKVDDSADEFITFGCWNNGLCSLENPPQNGVSAVMQELNSYVNANVDKVKFIAVSGDNYYPKKEKTDEGTIKYWNESDFNSGFGCLPTNVPVHLLMGNHDLESTQLLDVTNNTDKTPLCHIVKEEITKENPATQLNLKTDHVLFGNNIFVLFIDTSIYDMNNEDLQCYNTFMNSSFKNVREAQNHQRWRVNGIINAIVRVPNSQIENIVVIGHHPIFGVKLKNDTTEVYEKMNDEGISFFLYLKELLNLPKYKFFYLCADIHNYQHISLQLNTRTVRGANIVMDIEQYIVGTGGADLDNAIEVPRDIDVNGLNLIESAQMKECQIRNGFLICRNVNGELEFQFQPTRFELEPVIKEKKDKKDKKDKTPKMMVENNIADDYDPELYAEKFYGGKKRRTQKKRKGKTNKKQKKQKRNNKTTKKRNTRRNRCNHYNMHS